MLSCTWRLLTDSLLQSLDSGQQPGECVNQDVVRLGHYLNVVDILGKLDPGRSALLIHSITCIGFWLFKK